MHFLFTISVFCGVPVDGCHAQIGAVFVLSDHVPDAAEGGLCILVDGGP